MIDFIKKPIVILIGALLLLMLGAWVVNAITGGAVAKTLARLTGNQVEAAQQSGTDAVNTVGRAADREAASDALTRENEGNIRNAEGADAKVGAGVNNAGLAALCRRAAHRGSPRCKNK